MPEIVKELTITPALSATTDDPHFAEKAERLAPPMSEKSEAVGEVVPPPVDEKGTEIPKETKVEPTPGSEADATTAEKVDDTGTEKPGAKEDKDQTPGWVKAMISKEKNARAESDRKAAEADKRLAEVLEAFKRMAPEPKPMPVEQEPPAPVEDQFDDPRQYRAALLKYSDERAAWISKQQVQAAISQFRQQEAEKQKQTAEQQYMTQVEAFIAKGQEKYPDFEELVRRQPHDVLPISPAMRDAAMDMGGGVGQEVLYYLANHPAEARAIFAKPPVSQVREMTRLEAKLTAPAPVKPPTKAPAPIKPVGGNNVVEEDPEKMSTEAYIALRRKQLGKVAMT